MVFVVIVARSVPTGWEWQERLGARMLYLPISEGAQRMMRTAAPDALANIAAGARIRSPIARL